MRRISNFQELNEDEAVHVGGVWWWRKCGSTHIHIGVTPITFDSLVVGDVRCYMRGDKIVELLFETRLAKVMWKEMGRCIDTQV